MGQRLPRNIKTVEEYLKELRQSKKDKPRQVKEALEVYIELWETAIEKKVVNREESVYDAVEKLDAKGSLYKAVSD